MKSSKMFPFVKKFGIYEDVPIYLNYSIFNTTLFNGHTALTMFGNEIIYFFQAFIFSTI